MLEGASFDLELDLGKKPALDRLNRAICFLKNATQVATHLTTLQGSISPEEVPLNDLVQSIVETLQDDRVCFARHQGNPRVLGSRGHIQNALMELLANAQYFTPHIQVGGRIDAWVEVGSGVCAIHVLDNGPGVPPHLKNGKAFRLFESSQAQRTGMGLHYVQAVAQAHGGTLREIGTPPEGAHFVLELPTDESKK